MAPNLNFENKEPCEWLKSTDDMQEDFDKFILHYPSASVTREDTFLTYKTNRGYAHAGAKLAEEIIEELELNLSVEVNARQSVFDDSFCVTCKKL